MDKKVIILLGIPASGKSTWASGFVKGQSDWVIINKDGLRQMRGDYWIPSQENLITFWETDCIKAALASGYNIVIDNAGNFNPRHLFLYFNIIEEFKSFNYIIEFKYFSITLKEAIKRDSKRINGVGSDVITDFYKSYITDLQLGSRVKITKIANIDKSNKGIGENFVGDITHVVEIDESMIIQNSIKYFSVGKILKIEGPIITTVDAIYILNPK